MNCSLCCCFSCCLVKCKNTKTAQAVGKVSGLALDLVQIQEFPEPLPWAALSHTVKRRFKKTQNERGAVKGTDLRLNEDKEEEEETLFGLERLSHHQNPQMGRISCCHSLLVHHRKRCRLLQTADTCFDRIPTPSQWITAHSHLGAHSCLGHSRWSISHSSYGSYNSLLFWWAVTSSIPFLPGTTPAHSHLFIQHWSAANLCFHHLLISI